MQQIIQLKPEDDIAAIRARVENADLSHLVLVIPRGCAALESERGVQLLRRAAEDFGSQVALVAHDDDLRDRAEQLGFPVFNSIAQAQKTRWRMEPLVSDTFRAASGGRFFTSRQGRPPAAPPERAALPSARIFEFVKEYRNGILSLIVALLLLCAAAGLLVPTAKVRLVPLSIAMTMATEATADSSVPQITSSSRTIPARRITREISGTLQLKTTTQKQVPNAPSTGVVILTNLRAEETTIPPGLIVKTSAGVPIRFTTTTTVTLPAGVGSRVEAPIQAVEPGPSGNVKELAINTIDGSFALAARVINLKPMQSGTLKPVRVVTADDKKKLEEQLLKQLQQHGAELLKSEIKENEFLSPDSVTIDPNDSTFDRAVDEPAEVLNLRMTAVAFGLAIDRDDLTTMAGAILEKQMPEGYQLMPDGVKVEVLPGGKYQGIAFRFPFRATAYTTPQIDTGKVSRAVQGRSVDDAASYLASQIKLARPPEISVMPMGWMRLPLLAFRIAVFVEPQVVNFK
ncbi:hypothetical protein ANRL1_02384 [Anaerolineae bacterium]|nr:hypothetical protein ANRL1_02384 [Anaerolineae bacterium]